MLKISYDAMLHQLYSFCRTNSGSHHLSGLLSMHDLLLEAFKPLADEIQSISLPDVPVIGLTGETLLQPAGKALLIRKRPHLKRRVLLCGHMDTVYDEDHPFQTLTQLKDNSLNGPGVADMKGGLIVMLHALQAFEQHENASLLGWDVFINTDEELGSAASSAIMCDIAKHCQAALIYEPSMTPEGMLAKNRKGNMKVTLIATGVSAHAGRDFDSGRNAICYLAEVICAINHLNGQREGVTLNVGQIAGGTALNIVPDKAVAKVDVRMTLPEDEGWVLEQLELIKTRHFKKNYTLTVHSRCDRPPKRVTPPTELLFSRLCEIGKSIDIKLEWTDSGGCCDGNNLAQLGIPVLDTLGVRGGKIHTADEYILLDSLVERATLSALLLIDLAKNDLHA